MIKHKYETLAFRIDKKDLVVTLLNLFSARIPVEEITTTCPLKLTDEHTVEFKQEKELAKFSLLLEKHFQHLKNNLTGNSATYIHQNSGIPLIGNPAFGIIYRNSSIIEIKPITSCNLNCIYCSISEGLRSKKHDFVVEKDYLIEELKKLVDFVDEPVEIHIGVQGEPFLYADIYNLVNYLQSMAKVSKISIDTNGTLLSKDKINLLANNDKLQLNISLDAVDEQKAREIVGVNNYNVQHVQEMIVYACTKVKMIVAPVFVPGYNDQELEKIIQFIKSLPRQPLLGIQNFLQYKTGRHPARAVSWPEFYRMIETLEQKYQIKLKLTKEDFGVRKTKELPKPFREGDIVKATIKCLDRFPNTIVAVAQGRNLSVPDCKFKKDKLIKVKIIRDKHNIFVGKIV